MIKVKKLHKYFFHRKKNQIHALNDITLDLPEKGLVVLFGASGSGKTTLLNVLGGLDKVNSGIIDFNGEVFKKYNAKKWDHIRNKKVGYVFQNYNLLPQLSVYDNIAFVLKMLGINDPKVINHRVTYILEAVNMYQFRKKKALQLSGGQQQRVAIARALVKNPDVIIADEPTGNLDSKNTLEIMNIIKKISTEKLVLLVTHETNIANFYGDRIIEIKDGKVISDIVNKETSDHDFDGGDNIYLKDLYSHGKVANDNLIVEAYSDEEKFSPVKVRLIQKNNTLYLDIDAKVKHKLVDSNSGVVIKDEHFIKQTRKQLTETNFNLDALDNKDVQKEKAFVVSIKQSIELAFKKVLTAGRKAKLMMFSFFLAGIIIAVAVSLLANVALIRPKQVMTRSQGNIKIERNAIIWEDKLLSEYLPYDDLMALGEGEEDFYFNPYQKTSIRFLNPNGSHAGHSIHEYIEFIDYADEKDLIIGRMPEDYNEILITKAAADRVLDGGSEIGIWNYENILYERLSMNIMEGKVTGILDDEIPLIYMHRATAALVTKIRGDIIPLEFGPDELLFGKLPEAGEELISKTHFMLLFEEEPTESWQDFIKDHDVKISGIYDGYLDNRYTFMRLEDIERSVYKDVYHSTTIYSNNSKKMAEKIDSIANVAAKDMEIEAIERLESNRATLIASTLSSTGVLLLFALIGFYFLIRSSLMSRIYEISIFRALGIRKGDIFVSFIVEIAFITTVSTILGYVIAMFLLNALQKGNLFDVIFYVNLPTFIIGFLIAYLLNFLAGLLPVYLLLRKTPAQILTQYDI